MLFRSPFRQLCLPDSSETLPSFLLDDIESLPRAHAKLFYPPSNKSIFATSRPQAAPISLLEVKKQAYAVANGIKQGKLGFELKKGDVIVVFSPNQHDYVANVLGITLAGGVAALCNSGYKPRELLYNLQVTGAKAILTSKAVDVTSPTPTATPFDIAKETIGLLQQDLPIFCFEEGEEKESWKHVMDLENTASFSPSSGSQITSSDSAVLCFSSGTSGLPKAVSLSHGALIANIIQATFILRDRSNAPLKNGKKNGVRGWYEGANTLRPIKSLEPLKSGNSPLSPLSNVPRSDSGIDFSDEFHIDILPQFHCYGLMIELAAAHSCTPRVVLPRFHLPTFLSSIQDYSATTSFVVPPVLLALGKHPMVDQYNLSSLRLLSSGAASLATETIRLVQSRLGVSCVDGYGMTEMSPIISSQGFLDITDAPGTVGRLAPSTNALVLSPEGEELGYNESGELLVQGPQMMKGYWHNEEANKKAFYIRPSDGSKWYRTGDVVSIDERCYISVTDRLKDVIKVKGFQVSPAELEGLFFEDTRVQDVAVIGIVEGEKEMPWVFVVASPSLSTLEGQEKKELAASILNKVNDQVAAYKKVEGLTWLTALPKSASGKILKKDLPAMK